MFCLEKFPNELLLILFSYLTKFELIESFFLLNQRLNNLLSKYFSHINLSSIFTKDQIQKYLHINTYIHELTIDNYHIGSYFLQETQLDNLYRLKLIDHAIDLHERFQPEILNLVITSFNQETKIDQMISRSLRRINIEFHSGECAKNCLLNQLNLFSTSILIDVRLTLSKLSEYFQLFGCHFPVSIEKLYISIFSIDQTDDHPLSTISFPNLIDFQLEICFIPFHLIQFLLPSIRKENDFKRFAFIGQTTTINAAAWKTLLGKYRSIERFDFHISNVKHFQISDLEEWKEEFPSYSIDYNSLKKSFRIHSSKFDHLERLLLNECVANLNHLEYSNKISHLIIRSQYWCSYIDLSLNIQNDLLQRFHHVKRLTTTNRQLEYFLQTKFLHQIQQLDLEFAENYCFVRNEIAEQFIHLKSISFSSMYDGNHEINLHSMIKNLLFHQFSHIVYIYIDAIRIIDDQHVEDSILQWYSAQVNRPIVHYTQDKFLSIWF